MDLGSPESPKRARWEIHQDGAGLPCQSRVQDVTGASRGLCLQKGRGVRREDGDAPHQGSRRPHVPWGLSGQLSLLGGKGMFGAGKEMGMQGLVPFCSFPHLKAPGRLP